MGGGTTSSSSTTGSANQQVNSTLDSLLGADGGIQGVFKSGPHVFNQSLYSPAGSTTQGAWAQSLAAANNPQYASGVNSALGATNRLLNSGGLTSGMSGDIGTSTNVANGYGKLTGNMGLTNGMTGNQSTTNTVGNTFGQMANGAQNPSLTEQTLLNVAQGGALGQNDPGYAALRSKLSNDVMGQVGSGFTNSGRFGGGSYVNAATNDLTGALAPLDYQQYQDSLARQNNALSSIEQQRQQGVTNRTNDLNSQLGAAGQAFGMGQTGLTNIQNALAGQLGASGQAFNQGQTGISNTSALGQQLQGLFAALQAPSATAGAVGSAQDANAQGTLSGNADLFNRQQNGQLQLDQSLLGMFTGAAPVAGTTTTNTTPATPWWQSAIGLGVGLL